jgi:N-acetylated-alpha-linked acidic dipeptidase
VAGSQWTASASPSLAYLIKQTALDVPHPTIPGKTLWDARNDQGPLGPLQESNMTIDMDFLAEYKAREQEKQESLGVGSLGSGSDYTVFLQRIGVSHSAATTLLTTYLDDSGCEFGPGIRIHPH